MNLENIILSERSQPQKASYCMFLFIWNTQNRQSHTDRKSTSGRLGLEPSSGGGREGQGEGLLTGVGFLFGGDENVLKLTVVMVVPFRDYAENCWTVRLAWVNFMRSEFYLDKVVNSKNIRKAGPVWPLRNLTFPIEGRVSPPGIVPGCSIRKMCPPPFIFLSSSCLLPALFLPQFPALPIPSPSLLPFPFLPPAPANWLSLTPAGWGGEGTRDNSEN